MARKRGISTQATDPAERLYALPLTAFIAARNELATSLRKAGKADEAERVRGLARPVVSAWIVNQLYWHERPLFDALLDAGDRFRTAQQTQLAGNKADLVAALAARRDAVGALAKAAARRLHADGYTPTPDMLRRVTTSLEALASYGRSADAPRHGLLVADVPPPGFEALAALVPRVAGHTMPGHGSRRVLSFTETRAAAAAARSAKLTPEEQRERARTARRHDLSAVLQRASRDARRAKGAAAKARVGMRTAVAKATALERAAAKAVAEAEKASALAETARREARQMAESAEQAVQTLQDAEQRVERVQRELKDLR